MKKRNLCLAGLLPVLTSGCAQLWQEIDSLPPLTDPTERGLIVLAAAIVIAACLVKFPSR